LFVCFRPNARWSRLSASPTLIWVWKQERKSAKARAALLRYFYVTLLQFDELEKLEFFMETRGEFFLMGWLSGCFGNFLWSAVDANSVCAFCFFAFCEIFFSK
jgi:hypothetical protein